MFRAERLKGLRDLRNGRFLNSPATRGIPLWCSARGNWHEKGFNNYFGADSPFSNLR